MLSSVYSSLSSLISFSKGIDVISNNTANVNTPGFKRADLLYKDSNYKSIGGDHNNGSNAIGTGVIADTTIKRFESGELLTTGADLDFAIDGNGFFITKNNNEHFYTRNGRFDTDDDGFLVHVESGHRVMSLAGQSLNEINISSHQVNPANATTSIDFTGNVSSADADHTISDTPVYNSNGNTELVSIVLTNNTAVTPFSWLVDVEDSTGAVIGNGEIRYQADGSPAAGFNTINFNITIDSIVQSVELNFGAAGTFNGSTSFSTTASSTVEVKGQDGFSSGSLLDISVDEQGRLNYSYTNGQSEVGEYLAIAVFNRPEELVELGNSLFDNKNNLSLSLTTSGLDGAGSLSNEQFEKSNVDLAQQFTDLIILQRGFQGSSQILSIVSELMKNLNDINQAR